MEGVTILNTHTHSIRKFRWTQSAITTLIGTIIVILICVYIGITFGDIVAPAIFCGFWGGIVGLALTALAGETEVGTYNTYEVTVDDTVSMLKFNERYEVIEQRGKIYEVKDRNE